MRRTSCDDERGQVSVFVAMLVPALMLMVGLVVDGGGKVTAIREADAAAVAAARFAGDAAATGVVANQPQTVSAAQAARRYLAQAGVSGEVSVEGSVVQVQTTVSYQTKFVQVLGIGTLAGNGAAEANVEEVGP